MVRARSEDLLGYADAAGRRRLWPSHGDLWAARARPPVVLRLERVRLWVDGRCLAEDVSGIVRKGFLVAVEGESGVGKTKLVEAIMGLHRGFEGRILVGSEGFRSPDPRIPRRIGLAPQRTLFLERLTVETNLAVRAAMVDVYRGFLRGHIRWALDWVGVRHLARKRVCTLSGGELRRVSLARAIIGYPDLLIADEPTENLDPAHGVRIARILRSYAQSSKGVLWITHKPELARRFADVTWHLSPSGMTRESRHAIPSP